MVRIIEVEGVPAGDMECWCLDVDEKTYKRIDLINIPLALQGRMRVRIKIETEIIGVE